MLIDGLARATRQKVDEVTISANEELLRIPVLKRGRISFLFLFHP